MVCIAGTTFTVSQLPKSSILDQTYSETNTDADTLVYGVGTWCYPTQYGVTHEGWVGVTTYNDTDGNLRVKKETLVSMSGITTAMYIAYPTNTVINGLQ